VNVLDIIRKRQSVRKFLPDPVEDDQINTIIEAARLAPSSTNSQPWHFVVVKDKEMIKELTYAVPFGVTLINKFMEHAPLVIVGCVKTGIIQKLTGLFGRYNYIIDVSIAMEHMVLVAEELGLGTCWIGWFDEKKAKKLIKTPVGSHIVAMLALGHPAPGGTHPTTRKDIKEIFSINEY